MNAVRVNVSSSATAIMNTRSVWISRPEQFEQVVEARSGKDRKLLE